jgi:predicted flap endonuclease-1-like 5' DNA nuclease
MFGIASIQGGQNAMSYRSSMQRCSTRWWAWVLILLGLPLVMLLWWWLRRRAEEEPAAAVRIELKAPSRVAEEPAPAPQPAPPTPDDLKRVEGIGPKISGLLQAAGITTFAQLAATDVGQLKRILKEAGTRANPGTWSEQAGLAAAGDWDALEALQTELKGGRRV